MAKMIADQIMSPDGGWNLLLVLLWIVALPIVSVVVFILAALVAWTLHWHKGLFYRFFLWSSIVFGAYTGFNIADYCIYRWGGAIAISPINQGFFQLLCHPGDLYKPYASVVLSPDKTEYEVEFVHKYGGREEIAICIPDGERWIKQYDECLTFAVTAKGTLIREDGERTEIDNVANVKAFAPSKLSFEILRYRIANRLDCRKKYKLKIKFGGNYSEMVKYYASVCLVAENATTK